MAEGEGAGLDFLSLLLENLLLFSFVDEEVDWPAEADEGDGEGIRL